MTVESRALSVLHFTLAKGGGVPQAILDHVASAPEIRHHIVWPKANNHLLDTAPLPSVTIHGISSSWHGRWTDYRRELRTVRPDIVLAHSSMAGGLSRLISGSLPVAYQPHAYVLEDYARPRPVRLLFHGIEKALAKRAIAVIALTEREARIARSLGTRSIVLVPNTSRAWKADYYDHDGPIVACGRVCRQKDPLWFAELAEQCRRIMPGREWVWVGDGDEVLKARLESVGVRVTGWLDQHRVWKQLQSASAYVHTASYEGFPLALIDAATVGLPLLVRNIPAFEDYPGPKSNSVTEMSNTLTEVVADRKVAEELRGFAREYASAYSPQRQKDALAGFYEAISARLKTPSQPCRGSTVGASADSTASGATNGPASSSRTRR